MSFAEFGSCRAGVAPGDGSELGRSTPPRRAAGREWQDRDTLDLFRQYRCTGDHRVRDELIERHRWVAAMAVRRLRWRGEPLEDLQQVALLGMLKAVDRFDPERGLRFSTFAMPTVLGELRRHFRDNSWPVHVPRRAKELFSEVQFVRERLSEELQRAPSLAEIATALGTSQEVALAALQANNAYRPLSIDAGPGDDGQLPEGPLLGREDDRLLDTCGRLVLEELLGRLAERDRQVIVLRYVEGLYPREIAPRLGMSQDNVSRTLRKVLRALRKMIVAADGAPV